MAVDTKNRILDVSEQLFADSGFAATSLRDITSEAGVNLAAVNYHFGSKEALLRAVLERRFRPINEKRLAMLGELEATTGGNPTLEDILRAFLGPPFQAWAEAGQNGRKFLKLVGHIHSDTNEESRAAFVGQFDVILERFTSAMRRALPDLDPDEVMRRMRLVVGAMAHTMIWGEKLTPAPHAPNDNPNRLIESLVRFAAAGMAAPIPVEIGVPAQTRGGRR